jgi:AraC family transcriptional regulator
MKAEMDMLGGGREKANMEPKMIEQGELTLVGMVYYGNPFKDVAEAPEQNEVGKLWARFDSYWESHRQAFKHVINPKVGWELHITTDEYEETKEYFVMVGIEVSRLEDLPAPVFAKVLPAGKYAVFTLKGEQMTGNWGDAIYKEWLPSSTYEEALGCTIERYDEDCFKGWGDPDSEVQIWVPVLMKQ